MSDTPDILKKILQRKAEEIAERCGKVSQRELSQRVTEAGEVRGFAGALQKKVDAGDAVVIAEIKKALPSRGVLRE